MLSEENPEMEMKRTILLFFTFLCLFLPVSGDPLPGDIFREYEYGKKVDFFKGAFAFNDSIVTFLEISDLEMAVRAEISFYYWGGHIGTSNQKFRVNSGGQLPITQPVTPGRPECYYRTLAGRSAVQFPLDLLVSGKNRFAFFCGEQICHGYNWPHYWIYNYVVRIYYDREKPCAKGVFKSPSGKEVIGDYPEMEIEALHPERVKSVDFIPWCTAFDQDGDGKSRDWQYMVKGSKWSNTAGIALHPPFKAVWNNSWIPDQDSVRLMARITDVNGYCYMTEATRYFKLQRKKRSVNMYVPVSVNEAFGVRAGQRQQCKIRVDDQTLKRATAARLAVSTWSGQAEEEDVIHDIGVNGYRLARNFGTLHDGQLSMLEVPVIRLEKENGVYIHSETEGHALEINWPGPALLVETYFAEDDVQEGCHVSIDIQPGGYPRVEFGNAIFEASLRVNIGGACGLEHAIRDWILKNSQVNQAVEVIDACAQRGPLQNVIVSHASRDSLVMRLEYRECNSPRIMAVSCYTLLRNSPFIRIDYLEYPAGWWNTVDIGRPGGKEAGSYKLYGQDSYIRKIELYPQSTWNAFDREYQNDPPDGGSLNYKGYMVMLAGDPETGIGFGRIMPVRAAERGGIRILKLLFGKGFETFPATGDKGSPFTGAVFVFERGFDQALSEAMHFVDGLTGTAAARD